MDYKKKLVLTGVLVTASTLSAGANALHNSVWGPVADIQIMLGTQDIVDSHNITIEGDVFEGIELIGETIGLVSEIYIKLEWDLLGLRQGIDGAGGVLFDQGTIRISTSTDSGVTYDFYETIDASVDNIPFLAGATDHLGIGPISGLVIQDNVEGAFPGLYTDFSSLGNEVGSINLFGNQAGIFLQGTYFTDAEMPLPAAAWLFGSAVLSLAGISYRRKRNCQP